MEQNEQQKNSEARKKIPQQISRRKFISGTGMLIGGAIVYITGTGLLFLKAGQEKQKKQITTSTPNRDFVLLGDKNKFDQINDVTKVEYNTEIQDAWVKQNINGFVYMNKDAKGNLLIMSPVCTHLGCTVPFASKEEKMNNPALAFYCPCHGGEYDKFGRNIGGPPPRPLDIFQPIIQNGKIYFNYFSPIQRN